MARRNPKMPPAAVAKPAKGAIDAVVTPVDTVAPVEFADAAEAMEATAFASTTTSALAIEAVDIADHGGTAPAVTLAETTPIKAAESVVTAAEDAASTVQKDMTQMATQFDAPKMLNDVTGQTQSAMEKGQKFVAEFGEFGKGNVEAMVEAGKITAKAFETLGQDNADYTRRSFEGLTATMKSLASVKSPTEFFKLQSDYARQAFDGAVAQSSKNIEATIKLASDAAQPLSNRFAVAVEKVKTAA